MGFKTGLVIGFGAGYVLGARAGRGRYEDIRRWWDQLSGSSVVQRATEKTKVVASDQAKRTLHTVQSGVEKAGSAVKDRLQKDPTAKVIDELETHEGKPAKDNSGNPREAFGQPS